MLVPGHLATAALAAVAVAAVARVRGGLRAPVSLQWMLLPAALGALTPDLIDKSRMALGGSIYGRTIGHSVLFLVAITAVWVGWMGWMRVQRRRLASVDAASVGADPAARGRTGSASPGASSSASTSPGLSTAFGFWVLGVASHTVADLADDALRGLMRGGMVTSSWFAWPWATPYTHVARVREPWITAEWVARLDGVTGGTSPLEITVLLAAGLWVVVRVAGRREGRVAGRTGANGPHT